MRYPVEWKFKSVLYPWVSLFTAFSLPRFRLIYGLVDCPVTPTPELQQLAHDFALSYAFMMNNPEYGSTLQKLRNIPERITIHLIDPELLYSESRIAVEYETIINELFASVFTRLEHLGCAEEIYRWGKSTRTYCWLYSSYVEKDYFNPRPLWDWYLLLKQWAVLAWLEKPLLSAPDRWTAVIDKYKPIYIRPSQPDISRWKVEKLPLPDTTCGELQRIVLNEAAHELELETRLAAMMAAPESVWEDVSLRIFGVETWLSLEGTYRVTLNTWRQILNTLSSEDIQTLDKWGLQHKNDYPDIKALSESAPVRYEL